MAIMAVTRTRASRLHSTSVNSFRKVPTDDSRHHIGATVRRGEFWVNDQWLDQQVGDWRVAYRLGVSGGRCVIAEMRVMPHEPTSKQARDGQPERGTDRPVGEWNGSWNGLRAYGIPSAGITAELLRSIPIGKAATAARRIRPEQIVPWWPAVNPDATAPVPATKRGAPTQWTTRDYAKLNALADEASKGNKPYALEVAYTLKFVTPDAPDADKRKAAARVRTLISRSRKHGFMPAKL
jgi:hypothetical protein